MFGKLRIELQKKLDKAKKKGLYKTERIITTPQGTKIKTTDGKEVLNFCANNYLGLANHPEIIKAAKSALDKWGYGLSSVRFICGTQSLHKKLEAKISEFLGAEDSLLYMAAFDANGGVFEPILGKYTAIISDALNHASIIDGVRLSKAQRYRYHHSDMEDLVRCLKQAEDAKYRLIVTDGVFSMDGDIAKLNVICDLAEKYDAMVMVDDSHATGYIGKNGRGTAEYCDVMNKIDIITTTFGKALGGASGGCTSGRKEIIEMLRQKSRPYLFSNSLPPVVVGTTLKVLEMLSNSNEFRNKVIDNAIYFRHKMNKAGFELSEGKTAIVPVMLHNEPLALEMANKLLEEGVYVIGFAYPVVPKGQARIRVQLSAAHSREDIDTAVKAFQKIGKELKVI